MPFIVLKGILKLLDPFVKEIHGLDNIPNEPFIIVANHSSYLDPFVIHYSILPKFNRRICFLAMKGRTKPIWKIKSIDKLLRKWVVPYDDGKEEAMREMLNKINQGNIIGLFPAGPRSLDDTLGKGKTGAVRLALSAKAPIVPAGIIGTFDIAPHEKLIPKFKKIVIVKIGEPIYFDKYCKKKITKKLLHSLTDKVMREIARLSGKKYIV